MVKAVINEQISISRQFRRIVSVNNQTGMHAELTLKLASGLTKTFISRPTHALIAHQGTTNTD